MDNSSVVDPNITLPQHEANSMQRAAQIEHSLKQIKGTNMDGTSNVFHHGLGGMGSGNVGAAMGGGLGAGLLGGVLGGALLGGNGGLFGNRGVVGNGLGGDFVTQAGLQTALNGQTANQNTNAILQNLATIQQLIPENEGKVQLSIAGAQADINANINNSIQTAINGQAAINKNISESIATSLASQSQIKDLVLTTAAGLQLQAAQNTASIQTAVTLDGTATRNLINQINTDTLNRLLTVADLDRRDEQSHRRSRDVEVNVSQTVNQVQLQAQAQQQQQQQLILLSQIAQGFNGLQNAVATNSNLIIGNTGASTTGAQTASPINVGRP